MDLENINILMVMFMRDNGKMIKKMDLELFTSIIRDKHIKEILKKELKKVKEHIHGIMVINLVEYLRMELKMEKELLLSLMEQ